jgi:heat shock protein HslJ
MFATARVSRLVIARRAVTRTVTRTALAPGIRAAAMVLVVALGLAGCAGFPPGSGLDATEWRVTGIDGVVPVAGSEPFIRFEGDQLSGTTGCNSFGGGYTLAGDQLRIEPMSQTEMACDGPLGEQEAAMMAVLQMADRLVVAGDSMTISGPDGLLELTRVP